MQGLWKEYQDNITIVHFVGGIKPWKGCCEPWYQDLCQEWRKYGNDTREEEDCDDGDDYDDNYDGDDDDDDGDQSFKMMMLAV